MPTCRHDRAALIAGPGGCRGWAWAHIQCAPTAEEPSNLGGNRNQFLGGHKARPYDRAASGSVGADFISARNRVRSVPGPGGSGSLAAAGCLARGGLRTRHARPYWACNIPDSNKTGAPDGAPHFLHLFKIRVHDVVVGRGLVVVVRSGLAAEIGQHRLQVPGGGVHGGGVF